MNRLLQHFVADSSPTKSSGTPASPPPPAPPRSSETPKHIDPRTQSYLDKLDEIPLSSSNGTPYDDVDLNDNISSAPASTEATAVFASPPPTGGNAAANETVQSSVQQQTYHQQEVHDPQGQQQQEYQQYYDQNQYYYQQHQDHQNVDQHYQSSEDAAQNQYNGAYYDQSNGYYADGYDAQSRAGYYDQSQYDAQQQQSQQYYASNGGEYYPTQEQNSLDGSTYFANTSQDQMNSFFSSNAPSDISQTFSDQNDSINGTSSAADSFFGSSSQPLAESTMDNPFGQSNTSGNAGNFFASSTHYEEPVQQVSQTSEISFHDEVPAAADNLFGSSSSSFGAPAPASAFSPPKSPVQAADNLFGSTSNSVFGSHPTAPPPFSVAALSPPKSPARSATELFSSQSAPSPTKQQYFASPSPKQLSFVSPPAATVVAVPPPISPKKELSVHVPTITASPPDAQFTITKEVHSPKSPKTVKPETARPSSPKSPMKAAPAPIADSPKKIFSSTAPRGFTAPRSSTSPPLSSSHITNQVHEIIKSIRSASSDATYDNSSAKDEAWEVAEMYKKISERLQKEKDELLKILAEQADQFHVMQDYINQLQNQIAALALASPPPATTEQEQQQQQPVNQ